MGSRQPHTDPLARARRGWVLWFTALVVSAFAVPYGFLGSIPRVTASLLYWTLFGFTATISIAAVMRRWRD